MTATATHGETMPAPALALEWVTHRYGAAAPALKEVSFNLAPGEVHALVGENGAGKSTLMKILAGAVHPTIGQVRLRGQEVRFRSPADARRAGIAMIHQELCIAPNLSVLENLFLGLPVDTRLGFIAWGALRRRAAQWVEESGLNAPLDLLAGRLSWSERQLLEITRALHSGASILLMDEPTSALAPAETARLFEAIARLKAAGRSVVYTSHFLDETLAIADRALVLRNGEVVSRHIAAQTSVAQLVAEMTGTQRRDMPPTPAAAKPSSAASSSASGELLRMENLSWRRTFHDVSFSLRAGEMVGVFGAADAGFMALGRVLFGQHKPTNGQVFFDGRQVAGEGLRWTAPDACAAGIGFLSESRPENLFAGHSLRENLTAAALRALFPWQVAASRENALAQTSLASLDVRPPLPERRAGSLSGGNQQKVLLGRWLLLPGLKLLIVSEPTRGMDLGAKEEVVRLLREACERGIAVLAMSTEPELLLRLCERILVFRKGALVAQGNAADLDKQHLLTHS